MRQEYVWTGQRSAERLLGVVLAVRREDVENFGVFECGGFVLDSAGNEEGITGLCFEAAVRMLKDEMAADDVDELLVRVTVASADPALAHAMPDKHHAGAVTHDLAAKTVFRRGHDGVV